MWARHALVSARTGTRAVGPSRWRSRWAWPGTAAVAADAGTRLPRPFCWPRAVASRPRPFRCPPSRSWRWRVPRLLDARVRGLLLGRQRPAGRGGACYRWCSAAGAHPRSRRRRPACRSTHGARLRRDRLTGSRPSPPWATPPVAIVPSGSDERPLNTFFTRIRSRPRTAARMGPPLPRATRPPAVRAASVGGASFGSCTRSLQPGGGCPFLSGRWRSTTTRFHRRRDRRRRRHIPRDDVGDPRQDVEHGGGGRPGTGGPRCDRAHSTSAPNGHQRGR